jgi:hypothetical protein
MDLLMRHMERVQPHAVHRLQGRQFVTAFDLDAAMDKRIGELLADLPPLLDEDYRRAAAILATARPADALRRAS